MEDHACQEEGDALCAAVDGTCQAAGLAGEVEVQVEVEEVVEDVAGDAANGLLGDGGEDGVAEFLEDCRAYAGCAVCWGAGWLVLRRCG